MAIKTPRFTLAESMKHFWAGPRALVDAIDGCGADQLTPETALWLRRQGVNLLAMQNLFGVPAKEIDEMIRGARAAGGEVVAEPEPEASPSGEPVCEHTPDVAEDEPESSRKKKHLTPEARQNVVQLFNDGASKAEIARTLGVTWSTVNTIVRSMNDKVAKIRSRDESEAERQEVIEPVKCTTYKPVIPLEQLGRSRMEMEEMLGSLEADTRIALDDGDYSIAVELILQMHAVSISIDLLTAEIRRCEP